MPIKIRLIYPGFFKIPVITFELLNSNLHIKIRLDFKWVLGNNSCVCSAIETIIILVVPVRSQAMALVFNKLN